MADTNGLITAITQLADQPRTAPGPRCTVGSILGRLDVETVAKIRTVLDDLGVSSTQIADALTGNGHPVQAAAVARHRRRGGTNGCRCPR
ncbi:hypothetical protein ABT024_05470 [Streptomyces sp. NPDC002812]|uniref:hypothetical protein n=1 Tax=Streptomyces sp. NPDC002812 TaxID=3154434 RepID=UPI00332534D6